METTRSDARRRWGRAGGAAGLAAALLALAAPAAPAFGQPVLVTGPLRSGDATVGYVEGVRVAAPEWKPGTRLRFELPLGGDDDRAAVLHGVVDAADEGAVILGWVCSETRLLEVERSSDGFAVTALAGIELELAAGERRGVVVRVPAPVPTTTAEQRLLPLAALRAQCPEKPGPARPDLECQPFALHSRPEEQAASFEIAAARRVVARAGRDGWFQVEYDDFNGFRWLGFARAEPKCAEVPKAAGGLAGVGLSYVAQPEPCRQALIPRGAVLRAADRKTPLLTARRDFEARLCTTERAFEWEVELTANEGEVQVRGYFDGSPLPLPKRGGAGEPGGAGGAGGTGEAGGPGGVGHR